MTDYPHQWFGGQTYSQAGEDLAVINLFKRLRIEQPSYIDIGAHHPFELSNTALLYLRGSRGINVEANPDLIHLFNEERPMDQNVWAAVVPPRRVEIIDGHNVATLYRINETSGINSTVEASLKSQGGARDRVMVPAKTIEEVIKQYSNSAWPDFVSLDIEGCDFAVLESIDWQRPSTLLPKVFLVEALSTLGDASEALRLLMFQNGYYAHSWCGGNMLFTRAAFKHLLH